MKGFREFLMRGNLVGLAVAVVIGAAFTSVVQSLVVNIITPLIASPFGKPNFGALVFHIHKATFTYGLFLNALISFVLIVTVVYFFVVAPAAKVFSVMNRNKEAAERECPECLSQIPVRAIRCKFCTAEVPAAEQPVSSARHRASH